MPVEDDMEWDLSCSKLDAVEDSTLSKIQVALQKVLVPPTRRVTDGSVVQTNDTRLWVDKYGMDHGGVVGSSAAKTCQQLTEYMNHWRKLRKEAVERMAERQRKRKAKFDRAMGRKPGTVHKPKRRKKKADSDDDDFLYDDDCWDDDELGQHSIPLCLLTGPPSSGKTAMVHHVAKQCMCSVVEINTTEIRSGAALKNKIEEATKSSSLATMLQSKENQAKANFFGAGAAAPKAVADSEDDSEDDDTHTLVHSVSSKRKRDESSMTIVLIDEADIVFDTDGDSGFWTALASLAKSAKSPIILTANSFPMHLNALPCHFFSLNRPTPIECATKILQICRHEGMDLDPQIRKQGLDCVHEKLSQVASACGCDLRRMINELQFFSHSCGGKAWTVKKAATEVDSTECRVNKIDRRPTILSVEPHKVPMDKHTVITIKGKNLLLHRGENAGETTVWVGKHQCKSRILDDETMLLLCPPYSSMEEDDCKTFCSRMMKRVVPLSITCKSMGVFNSTSRVVKSETMINGVSNVGISWNLIEYVFPEEQVALDQDNESNGNIEEFELQQDDYTTGNESRIFPMSGLWVEEGEEHGIALRDGAMSGLPDSIPKMQQRIRTSQDDVGSLKMLHATAVHASNNSDATLIEDFQYGVPFLAGACKGFGFEFTQDCLQNSSDIDKLRFHENSRPPREEKLYELGWKDNCYFFGNPETYMTPLSMKLGKYANDVTDFFRGRDSVGEGSVPTPFVPVENIDSREDFDFMAHCACSSNEEDAYLSVPIPASLQSLPGFLRQHAPLAHPSALDKSLDYLDLDKERKDKMAWLKDKANYILPRGFKRTRWSYGRLGLCSRKENRDLVLEMLPMLRRIGLYEQAAELEELQKGDDATKIHQRTTRRQVKARRNHYFDRLSLILRRNEADLNSSEVGALIATDFLVYPVQK
jgi:DNA polymerase III delta prime subunit